MLTILAFSILSTAGAQGYANLEKVLNEQLSETATKDGRWVFHSDKGNIEKMDKPLVKAVIPNFDIYKVTLTHYLGSHINETTCIILFDSAASRIILEAPLWYDVMNKDFIKLFLKKKFDNKTNLLAFLDQFNDLLATGSGCKITRTALTDEQAKYDIINFKGDSYTTSGGGAKSTVSYYKDEVWRQVTIDIDDLQLIRYTVVNPATNKKELSVK